MQLLIDFLPVLLFFIAYKFAGIYVATGIAIAVSVVQVSWNWWRHRRVETLQLATLGLIVVFGGLTLALHDPIFVMWKPTLINGLFAVVFFGSHWFGERNLIERMMGHNVTLPPLIWSRLNFSWAAFFAFLGVINLFVVYVWSGFFTAQQTLIAESGQTALDLTTCAATYTDRLLALCEDAQAREAVWVNFKLFGMMGLTVLFVIAQAFYLARHVQEPASAEAD
ncbi:septation protein A [Chromatium okenii]|uniref:Inner membrane-spanning protein YciB n=1 Tax=Chromatium okenii TaxID=61644 RepID=A0A2S7XMD5_9GAMM|nr:septation protein A [Chromatium okenii]MBV5310578.1 septation protein A [Chromatium okenii]PQJ94836.1 septation protein A [Chromatium okenii]PQJ94890.1 septation protein A [Chromatium okenii]